MPTLILLLRGINVGGNKKLPMKELAALLEGLGCTAVRTYIQSGNAVVEAPAGLAKSLAAKLEAAIVKKFKFEAPVVVRSAAELKAALKAYPYSRSAPERAYIGFLKDKPSAAGLKALDPAPKGPGEDFKVIASDIHFQFPQGVAKTKLTNAWFDSRLRTVCTLRNLNTCEALLTLAEGKDA
jgi:uncharacterized protein (DUF1697 family)